MQGYINLVFSPTSSTVLLQHFLTMGRKVTGLFVLRVRGSHPIQTGALLLWFYLGPMPGHPAPLALPGRGFYLMW